MGRLAYILLGSVAPIASVLLASWLADIRFLFVNPSNLLMLPIDTKSLWTSLLIVKVSYQLATYRYLHPRNLSPCTIPKKSLFATMIQAFWLSYKYYFSVDRSKKSLESIMAFNVSPLTKAGAETAVLPFSVASPFIRIIILSIHSISSLMLRLTT